MFHLASGSRHSLELPAKGGKLLLDFGQFPAQARYVFFECGETIGDWFCASSRGRTRHNFAADCIRRFAREEVHVTGFFRARLARKNPGQRRFTLGEAI